MTIISALIIIGGLVGYLGMFFGVYALIELKAMQKSTHKIQYVPITEEDVKLGTENLNNKINQIHDDLIDDGIN